MTLEIVGILGFQEGLKTIIMDMFVIQEVSLKNIFFITLYISYKSYP